MPSTKTSHRHHSRKLSSDMAALEFRLAMLDAAHTFADVEAKYNHNHDQLGLFTFSAGGGRFGGGGAGGSWGAVGARADGRRNTSGQIMPLNNVAVLANGDNGLPRRPGRHPDGLVHRRIAAPTSVGRSYTSAPGVIIPPAIEAHVEGIASSYRAATGQTMMVNSGTRTSEKQAQAMYDKFKDGDSGKHYKDHHNLKQIHDVYQAGMRAGKNQSQIVGEMKTIIDRQIVAGIYISKHLTGRAIDVRTRDLTDNQKRSLIFVARAHGGTTLYEGKPPHLHIQF